MHHQKGKKILIYIFLLLLVGSVNNIYLNNLKFEKIKDINIVGLDENDNYSLLKEIKNLDLNNIFLINRKEITNQINLNNLVEEFNIFKIYPSSIIINIKKTKFLAKISVDKKTYLVGSNGKFSENNFLNNHLPFIFGKPNLKEFLKFKKIIDQSSISYNNINNLFYYPSNRWDIELKNNKLIKLSKDYTKESLDLVSGFLDNEDFKDIKIIDARIKNQIILND
jgi:cell division septal protein FtsQ